MEGDLDIRTCGAACLAREADEGLHVVLEGDLDMASVPELERVLNLELARGYPLIHLDLKKVQFIDSVGIRLVMALYRRKHPDGEMRVVKPHSRNASHALELVGLGKLVRFAPCADSARDGDGNGDGATSA